MLSHWKYSLIFTSALEHQIFKYFLPGTRTSIIIKNIDQLPRRSSFHRVLLKKPVTMVVVLVIAIVSFLYSLESVRVLAKDVSHHPGGSCLDQTSEKRLFNILIITIVIIIIINNMNHHSHHRHMTLVLAIILINLKTFGHTFWPIATYKVPKI